MGPGQGRDYRARKIRQERIDANPPVCAHCGLVIPKPRRYARNVKFCTPEHGTAAAKQKQAEAKVLVAATRSGVVQDTPYPEHEVRRGPYYDLVKERLAPKLLEDWTNHHIADHEIAVWMGEGSPQAWGRVRKALFNDRLLEIAAQNYNPKQELIDMLGPSDDEMYDLAQADRPAFEALLDDLVEAFVSWRTHFFKAGRYDYQTKDYHRRWIRAVLEAIYLGQRTLILSPPRHGKTDLLIHFCVWQIIRNSNVRILWVGPNGDIAENCLGQVRDLLETHEALAEAYLGPGQSWAPARRGGNLWTRDKFTVANRTAPQKQPTMWAAGVEGKIHSLDADFIVVDDPADPDKSYTPGGRDRIANWFKQKLITRKMDGTGVAVISSRVHPHDLYSEFIDSENWMVWVDKAHDKSICGIDLYDPHDTEDCVLFPEMNPLRYLREQCDDVGLPLFEMMYLNQPRPDGTLIFDPDIIRAKCLDNHRSIGLDDLPGSSYRLVAGLDPAAAGVQAAFLWAVDLPSFAADYDPEDPRQADRKPAYYMVDMETQSAGGIGGAETLILDWYDRYGVQLWVIEDEAYQRVFWDDPRIRKLQATHGIEIRPAHTSKHKHDPIFGVSGQARRYHEGLVRLPYFGSEAVRKTDALIRQLTNFTDDPERIAKNRGKRGFSDILMSSWFPFSELIPRWEREARRTKAKVGPGRSYPGYNTVTYATPPWGSSTYIGSN